MTDVWKQQDSEEPPSWPSGQQGQERQPIPPVPSNQWDGSAGSLVGSSIRHGIRAFRENMNPFLVIGLVIVGFSVVLTFVQNAVLTYEFEVNAAGEFVVNGPSWAETFFVQALTVAVVALVYTWFASASQRIAAEGVRVLASDAFKVPQAAVAFWAAVVMVGATSLGSALLIVPGVVAWFFLCFAPLAAIDGVRDLKNALATSAKLVRANAGPVFLLQLAIAAAVIPLTFVALAFIGLGARGGTFGQIVTSILAVGVFVAFAASSVGANVYAFRTLSGKPVVA